MVTWAVIGIVCPARIRSISSRTSVPLYRPRRPDALIVQTGVAATFETLVTVKNTSSVSAKVGSAYGLGLTSSAR
jgi:hypothetical protein